MTLPLPRFYFPVPFLLKSSGIAEGRLCDWDFDRKVATESVEKSEIPCIFPC